MAVVVNNRSNDYTYTRQFQHTPQEQERLNNERARNLLRETSLLYLQRLTLRFIDERRPPAVFENGMKCCFCMSWIFTTTYETWCNRKFFTDFYRRARAEAVSFLGMFIFSLLKNGIRDAWIITEILVSTLSVCLSVATISSRLDMHTELASVELVLSILFFLLSLMDVVFDFTRRWQKYYRNVKAWFKNYLQHTDQSLTNDTQVVLVSNEEFENNQIETEPGDGQMQNVEDNTIVADIHEGAVINEAQHSSIEDASHEQPIEENLSENNTTPSEEISNANELQSSEEQTITQERQQSIAPEFFLRFSDPIRSIVSELLIYPLLIASLFQFVTGRGYDPSNAIDGISLALFIINILFLIAGVYLVRIVILVTFIRTIIKLKAPLECIGHQVKLSTLLMSLWTVHIIWQMITQILLIIYIGVRIHYENSTEIETLNVSWRLWLVIIGGFFLPVIGTLIFFCNVYYLVQDFSLSLFLGLLGLLQKKAFPDAVFEKDGFDDKKKQELARKLIEEIHYEEVLKEYKKNETNRDDEMSLEPLFISYRNPFTVASSLGFTLLLCGYLYCMFVVLPHMEAESTGNSIVTAGIFALLAILISNCYTISIATFWVSPPLWYTLFLIPFFICSCCLLYCCLCTGNM